MNATWVGSGVMPLLKKVPPLVFTPLRKVNPLRPEGLGTCVQLGMAPYPDGSPAASKPGLAMIGAADAGSPVSRRPSAPPAAESETRDFIRCSHLSATCIDPP